MESAWLTRTAGDHLYVRQAGESRERLAILRGKHRLDERRYSPPIAVGDWVLGTGEENRFVIHDWAERKNWLVRIDPQNPHRHQILCANIDRACLLVTMEKPFTPLRYIDGFLVLCEAFGIQAGLLFTKADYRPSAKADQRKAYLMGLYESLGYQVKGLSAQTGQGIEALKASLQGQVTFLTGLSGVGKSSLINALIPGLDLPVQPLAKLTQRGRHTTTHTALYDLPSGGAIIDSPGFGEFTPAEMTRQELSHFFPEMRARASACRYANCLHVDEPSCAIQEAVRTGEIAHTRYHTYLALLERLPTSLRS